MAKTLHFKSKRKYNKYLAFINIHHKTKHHHNRVVIAGHPHKVKH